jgi:serine/threonine protein kinase
MSYKHKYYKYKQKYLNLLYGGVKNMIQIRHRITDTPLTKLPFFSDVSYATRDVLELPFVQTMPPEIRQQITDLLAQKQDKGIIDEIDARILKLEFDWNRENKKDKENINHALLTSIEQEHKQLLQKKEDIEKTEKPISGSIFRIIRNFFIENYYIIIDGIHIYDFSSYVSLGGQGIIFRIVKRETGEKHIIKIAIRDNCDEIKHEAEVLTEYNREHGRPTTFTPYLPIFYHDGGRVYSGDGAMDVGDDDGRVYSGDGAMDVGDKSVSSICFIVYEDVGNEDLNTFIRRCRELIESNTNPQELEDRIRMIPYILFQVALQLEYYKHYRHNDIRLQNIVIDVQLVSSMAVDKPVYIGTQLKLLRVTIIDFGLFDKPENNKFSLLYIASQEALEQIYKDKYSDKQIYEGKHNDNQNSDLIGFFWLAIELITLSQIGQNIIESLIKHILSNKHEYDILSRNTPTEEMIKKKTLLFIYQLLLYNSPEKLPISDIFAGMTIDEEIIFDTIFKSIIEHKKRKVLEILFINDKSKYNSFIRHLFVLLTPISKRPSIERVIIWLKKQFPVLVSQ